MPATTKKQSKRSNAPSKAVTKTAHKRALLREQSRLLKILFALIIVLVSLIITVFIFDRMKANELTAKASRWTQITPPGKDAGIRFVACKQPYPGDTSGYDATIVAAKADSLKLTKRNAEGKPLSTNPPNPQVYTGVYMKSTDKTKPGYGYQWVTKMPLQTVPSSANVWWANEVTATRLSSRSKGGPAAAEDRLLVYGMSDTANAPTFRRSGSGQIIVTGVFNGLPPQVDNYSTARAYLAARTAWEAKAPLMNSLVTCQ